MLIIPFFKRLRPRMFTCQKITLEVSQTLSPQLQEVLKRSFEVEESEGRVSLFLR